MTGRRRARALGGVVGPAAFIAAWSILGSRLEGYSPVENPISRLAAVGAPTRVAMTGGFVAFAAGVSGYAVEARRTLSPSTAVAAGVTAVATLAVGALPLGASFGDTPHAVAAGSAYAALALTPLAGAAAFRAQGRHGLARLSIGTAVAIAALLVGSTMDTEMTGLFQRSGLTVGDVWIAATAIGMARGRLGGPSSNRHVC